MKQKILILFIGIIFSVNTVKSQYSHDIAVGPFMHFPCQFYINTWYNIQTRIQNVGTSNETNVPIKFFVNGTLATTTNKNLLAGQIDSVNNIWSPSVSGIFELKYVSCLANDTNHSNDTIKAYAYVFATLINLCEGFNLATFPPCGWIVAGAGASYWHRASVSAFGNGTGSAVYDMWNAPAGTIGDLITLKFAPTISPQDSIHFALAYCMFSSSANDEVAIYSSTNGGSSYTLLHTMTAVEMQTVSSCTHPFVPTASQWGRRAFVLPVGTNMIKFEGISAFGDGAYLDSIGTNECFSEDFVNNEKNIVPTFYSLSQNYPNPFNPTTNIKFALPKAGDVKLVVYDILGAQVATLVNGNMKAGDHSITFNAENFASGVYFYKIEAGDFTFVKKMVLVK